MTNCAVIAAYFSNSVAARSGLYHIKHPPSIAVSSKSKAPVTQNLYAEGLHNFFRKLSSRGAQTASQPRSPDELQLFQGAGVFRAGGDQVDTGGLHRGVAQYVRQSDHVPAGSVIGPREQVP